MEKEFNQFIEKITLTTKQKDEAKTKYTGVCKKVHDYYYDCNYDGSTKFLFGSYKLKTNIRPITKDQDVDVLIKLPQETFEKFNNYQSNGQSALLEEVKSILKEKYTTTDKIKSWGKVILLQFEDSTHNIELLPAFEQDDNSFKIPNTENGGSWEVFNPRAQIDAFNESNKNSDGLTRKICKMVKKWRNFTTSVSIKSCSIQDWAIDFLASNKVDQLEIEEILQKYFEFIRSKCSSDNKSYVETVLKRIEKAINYIDDGEENEASQEFRKIFGNEFPLVEDSSKTNSFDNNIFSTPRPWLEN
ncbi:MAG: nucleotidyltransferase [Treponema sp. CETP13]|nr:MAG: nucleotidyltransferase [Treponema sp. CETP13]